MKLLNNSKLFIAAAILSVGFYSCNKDDETDGGTTPSETTSEEDEASVEQSFNSMDSYSTSFQNGEGFKVMQDFSNSESEWQTTLSDELEMKMETPAEGENFQVNYDNNTGEYTWNHTTESWDKSAHDLIVLHFPSSNTVQENDLTFTLSEYTETPSTITDGDYLPTSLKANLVHNDEEISNVDFSADYNDDLPSFVNCELFVKPLTFNLNYNNSNNQDISMGFSIENSTGDQISTEHNFVVNTPAAAEEWSMDNAESANGFFSVNEVSYVYNADLSQVTSESVMDAETLNNVLDLTIEVNGQQKAEIFFETNDVEETIAMVRFSDGTTKEFSTYYETLMQ